MKLPEEQVVWAAKLAQIELSEEEKAKYVDSLSTVISYVDELAAVDVSGVDEMTAANSQITGLVNVMAVDEVGNCEIPREEFLKRAPVADNKFIVVKKVLDK